MFAKATETAIAALGQLAKHYDDGKTLLSAESIATGGKLQRPWVSKILTTLAQAGLVRGTRGPGGGFTLARAPEKILLADAVSLFERTDAGDACPFGNGVCGDGDHCPLHDEFLRVREATDTILHQAHFGLFRAQPSQS